jgi:hypothetical protein
MNFELIGELESKLPTSDAKLRNTGRSESLMNKYPWPV